MNELRKELEQMGPERVRRGMVAFEHRASSPFYYDASVCADFGIPCCFHRHARPDCSGEGQQLVTEAAFENWRHRTPHTRADLYAECVAYLAEHGVAVEPSPSLRGAV